MQILTNRFSILFMTFTLSCGAPIPKYIGIEEDDKGEENEEDKVEDIDKNNPLNPINSLVSLKCESKDSKGIDLSNVSFISKKDLSSPPYFMGGHNGRSLSRKDGVWYDKTEGSWKKIPSLDGLSARYRSCEAHEGNQYLMWGGAKWESVTNDIGKRISDGLYVFNGSSAYIDSLSLSSRSLSSCEIINGRLYVWGGESYSLPLGDGAILNLSNSLDREFIHNQTKDLSSPPARYDAAMFKRNNNSFIIYGGYNELNRLYDVWSYDIPTKVWKKEMDISKDEKRGVNDRSIYIREGNMIYDVSLLLSNEFRVIRYDLSSHQYSVTTHTFKKNYNVILSSMKDAVIFQNHIVISAIESGGERYSLLSIDKNLSSTGEIRYVAINDKVIKNIEIKEAMHKLGYSGDGRGKILLYSFFQNDYRYDLCEAN